MSPRDEFVVLAKLFLELYGKTSSSYWRSARLGGLRVWSNGNAAGDVIVDYLRPCNAQYVTVWSDDEFRCEDWYVHLETLRNKLVLDRLASIPK